MTFSQKYEDISLELMETRAMARDLYHCLFKLYSDSQHERHVCHDDKCPVEIAWHAIKRYETLIKKGIEHDISR